MQNDEWKTYNKEERRRRRRWWKPWKYNQDINICAQY
jgi:hypothetical protein